MNLKISVLCCLLMTWFAGLLIWKEGFEGLSISETLLSTFLLIVGAREIFQLKMQRLKDQASASKKAMYVFMLVIIVYCIFYFYYLAKYLIVKF